MHANKRDNCSKQIFYNVIHYFFVAQQQNAMMS